jgi:hypothetical protein
MIYEHRIPPRVHAVQITEVPSNLVGILSVGDWCINGNSYMKQSDFDCVFMLAEATDVEPSV